METFLWQLFKNICQRILTSDSFQCVVNYNHSCWYYPGSWYDEWFSPIPWIFYILYYDTDSYLIFFFNQDILLVRWGCIFSFHLGPTDLIVSKWGTDPHCFFQWARRKRSSSWARLTPPCEREHWLMPSQRLAECTTTTNKEGRHGRLTHTALLLQTGTEAFASFGPNWYWERE